MSKKKNKPYDFYYKKNVIKKESKNLDIIEKLLILASVFSYLLLFFPLIKNMAIGGHDAGSHISYLRIFTDALSQGQFPVRWIEWANLGQNQPLFSFYQPLLYYLAQIPHFLGMSILNSLYITILLLWILSGFLVFLFIRNITKSSLAGLASSLVYVFSPYHILDVFVRAAYPEFTALSFVPGLFWAIERYFKTQKTQYLGFLALFFAAVFTAHPPTLIMFSFPFGLYFFFLLLNEYKNSLELKILLKKALKVVFSLVLGFGLASFFAIPALLEQNLINSSSLNLGYLDFRNHFVCLLQLAWSNWGYGISEQGCMDQISFQVGILNWIVILLSLGLILYNFYRKIKKRNDFLLVTWLIIAFLGMYMTLSFSLSFWEGVPYLSFLQFPWRFLSIVIFASSVLTGILFSYIDKKVYKIIFYIFIAILSPLLVFNYLKPVTYLPNNYFLQDSPDFYRGVSDVQKNNTAELGYMPKNAQVLVPAETIPVSEIQVLDSKGTQVVLKNDFTYKEYLLDLEKPSKVLLYIHYFPGWEFTINNIKVKPDYSNIYGFVYLNAGAGENRIVAKFINTPLISFVNLVSLISLIITIILLTSSFWGLNFSQKLPTSREEI